MKNIKNETMNREKKKVIISFAIGLSGFIWWILLIRVDVIVKIKDYLWLLWRRVPIPVSLIVSLIYIALVFLGIIGCINAIKGFKDRPLLYKLLSIFAIVMCVIWICVVILIWYVDFRSGFGFNPNWFEGHPQGI